MLFRALLSSLIVLISLHAFAVDCVVCDQMRDEIDKIKKDHEVSSKLLSTNQEMLKALSPNEISKKVKLTSNILILSSKVETLENNRAVREQDALKLNCAKCPPRPKLKLPPSDDSKG